MQKPKLSQASFSLPTGSSNPWSSSEVDRLEFETKDFNKIVEACRFFYKKDPIASSTINKLVEIGINDLLFSKNKLSANEFRIFQAVKDDLLAFAENLALEYLISGLVAPEIKYARVTKEKVKELGIKNYDTLILPVSMWIRDPSTLKIQSGVLSNDPSYFYKVPDSVVYFIQNKGKFNDGTYNPKLWEELKTYYSDFITAVLAGQRFFLLDGDLIFRRKYLSNDAYPIPYLFAALENLKHKRNLRRMDYSIASRVISAIQLFKLGNDEFPVTEDNQADQFDAIRQQMYSREGAGLDLERIFQLFANHTLEIEWIYPNTEALLNEQKYESINQDIIYALGFPRVLITGESQKTGTSDPQYAMLSPVKTMEHFRKKILRVIRNIVYQIASQNGFKSIPDVKFKPLRLFDYEILLKSLADLYGTGNLSRQTYSDELGYDWTDETDKREEEMKVLKEKNLPGFAEKPFSQSPSEGEGDSKPSDIKKTSPNKDGKN
jgi:hypothetical protein